MMATRLIDRRSIPRKEGFPVSILPAFGLKSRDESHLPLRALGWASVAVGVAALGLYVGRELRIRYKFKHRTPSDIYSHAGDEYPSADYGVGI
jgi:hypothetical protein